jgi:hypothetical protein
LQLKKKQSEQKHLGENFVKEEYFKLKKIPPNKNMFLVDEEAKPMSQENIDKQIQINYKPNKENDAECAICFVDFILNEELKMLECGHYFHVHCINGWLKKKAVCPKD